MTTYYYTDERCEIIDAPCVASRPTTGIVTPRLEWRRVVVRVARYGHDRNNKNTKMTTMKILL